MRLKITLFAILVWSIGVAMSLWTQQTLLQRTAVDLARNDAIANLRKDMAIRKWAASMGMVFVDDSKVRDSPTLSEQERVVAERNTGQKIRLVSLTPIHILLGIQETHEKEYGIKERLTSLQLRNPDNAPDDWEQKALKNLQEGAKMVSDVTTEKGGHGLLRLMLPMQMEQECLECHRDTLVPVGGLRGAAAITIDLGKYRKAQEPAWRAIQYGHLAILLLGIASILTTFVIARRRAIEHERAEEDRREAELAFSTMTEGAMITDVSGKIIWVNGAFCSISGYSREEAIGKTPRILKSGHHDDAFYHDMWKQLTATGQWRGEVWNKRKSGEIYPEELSIHSLKEESGKLHRYVAIFSDITERKRAEEKLQDSEKKFSQISATAQDAILMMDDNQEISYWNHSAERLFGYSEEEAIGQALHRLIVPQRYFDAFQHGFSAYLQSGTGPVIGRMVEVDALKKDGNEFPVELSISSAIIGGRRYAIGIIRDITERRRAADALARSNAELQRFAEISAHHLQEPARRIASYAERLTAQLAGRLEEPQARLSLEYIGQQARRQQNLLHDIELYLAASQPRGEVGVIDARKVVTGMLEEMADRISDAGAEITLGDLPAARIDAARLRDLFAVVLDNALNQRQSNNPLRIEIAGERRNGRVRYSVSDNGPGVEPEYREQVFQVFERLATAGEGTGIGLAILRRVVESTGGRAWIEVTPGGGCRVLFDLPAGETP